MGRWIGTACAKAILMGEHAVVYCQPALAMPVSALTLSVTVEDSHEDGRCAIRSDLPGTQVDMQLVEQIVHKAVQSFDGCDAASLAFDIRSAIPTAAGLGSSAALSVALIRALLAKAGKAISRRVVSTLAFELEKLCHKTPSGIDNTVIAYERPLLFVKGKKPVFLKFQRPAYFLLVDCGRRSQTAEMVEMVRRKSEHDPEDTSRVFRRIGQHVNAARISLEKGKLDELGQHMSANHELLKSLGISTPELDEIVDRCIALGALGAKLTGSGGGGHVLVLCGDPPSRELLRSLESSDIPGKAVAITVLKDSPTNTY